MHIEEDYSYISNNEKKIIDAGYGKISVYSIFFDRYFTEKEKKQNAKVASELSEKEWTKRCDDFGKSLDGIMKKVLSVFTDKYDIHQVSEEKSTYKHYNSDWDLFFWSNEGWNGKNYMDCFRLSFNEHRTTEKNIGLLNEIVSMLHNMKFENIYCRVQYEAVINDKDIKEEAKKVYESLAGKFIIYSGMTGKIKVVSKGDGNKEYGFFKKNARNKYYRMSNIELLAMSM